MDFGFTISRYNKLKKPDRAYCLSSSNGNNQLFKIINIETNFSRQELIPPRAYDMGNESQETSNYFQIN
jgi:hypothetical protein